MTENSGANVGCLMYPRPSMEDLAHNISVSSIFLTWNQLVPRRFMASICWWCSLHFGHGQHLLSRLADDGHCVTSHICEHAKDGTAQYVRDGIMFGSADGCVSAAPSTQPAPKLRTQSADVTAVTCQIFSDLEGGGCGVRPSSRLLSNLEYRGPPCV